MRLGQNVQIIYTVATMLQTKRKYQKIHMHARPLYYAKSPTAQDTFILIPGLISCAGVTRWDCYLM